MVGDESCQGKVRYGMMMVRCGYSQEKNDPHEGQSTDVELSDVIDTSHGVIIIRHSFPMS
jgi:hypothetical protein